MAPVKVALCSAAVSTWFLTACSGTKVALNERLFILPSMDSAGAGGTLYDLGGGNASGTSTSGLGLAVAQRSDGGEQVFVDVTQSDGTRAVEKSYDQSFFRSGQPDEFTVAAAFGRELLLKYWGTMDASGTAGCPPLDDNGPPATVETNDGSADAESGK
jgi:hypothetical protein